MPRVPRDPQGLALHARPRTRSHTDDEALRHTSGRGRGGPPGGPDGPAREAALRERLHAACPQGTAGGIVHEGSRYGADYAPPSRDAPNVPLPVARAVVLAVLAIAGSTWPRPSCAYSLLPPRPRRPARRVRTRRPPGRDPFLRVSSVIAIPPEALAERPGGTHASRPRCRLRWEVSSSKHEIRRERGPW